MNPMLFGYIRLLDDVSDDDLDRIEAEFELFAAIEGFTLADVFYENDEGTQIAFCNLIAELKRQDVHHVVVPTYDHLSRHRVLRITMFERLDLYAHAFVHPLSIGAGSGLWADSYGWQP